MKGDSETSATGQKGKSCGAGGWPSWAQAGDRTPPPRCPHPTFEPSAHPDQDVSCKKGFERAGVGMTAWGWGGPRLWAGSELLAITTDSQRPWLVSRRVWAQAGLSLA